MKKILIISPKFPPSPSVGALRIVRICKYLPRFGWEIFVLTLKDKYYESNEDFGKLDVKKFSPKVQVLRTSKIDVVSFLVKLRASLLNFFLKKKTDSSRRAEEQNTAEKNREFNLWVHIKDIFTSLMEMPDKEIQWLPFAVLTGVFLIKRKKINYIFSSGPPHSAHVIALFLKLLTGGKFIADFRDPWARSQWEVYPPSFLGTLEKKLNMKIENLIVKHADKVVLVTEELKKDFYEHYGKYQDKFQVFYNGFDSAVTKYIHLSKKKSNSKVIFSHVGSLYQRRDPSPILFALYDLIKENNSIKDDMEFRFVGPVEGEMKQRIRLKEELGLADMVTFLPSVDYEKSLDLIHNSDVLILLQPYTTIQLPAKFFDYILFDKTLLAIGEKGSVIDRLVTNRFGLFANYHDVREIKATILRLFNNPGLYSQKVKGLKSEFDISKNAVRLNGILSS